MIILKTYSKKPMNTCPCSEERPMIGLEGHFARPRLFNWITILLVTAWVVVVGIVAQTSQTHAHASDSRTFVETLAR